MIFRTDINALRALAVLAVMFYHFKLPGMSGGFAGVDIFFVISGFLMTGIIAGGMQNDSFSLWRFYTSRARRLVPALVVLCAALVALGWFWLPPSDYKQLGRHAATALTFSSNFIFKNESGYFDTLSQDKWLLHTWSLSVEWQFYLIYPLLLLGIRRIGGGLSTAMLARVLLAITLTSLAFCIVATPRDPALAFFLLPARMWEMSLGGLAYLYSRATTPSPAAARGLGLAGLAMMAVTIFTFDGETMWPGAAALLPTLGCALVLVANTAMPRWLTTGAVKSLGLWSYSIYLWHWPVVVALRHFDQENSLLWDMIGVALSIILGALSYHLIETPLRQPAKPQYRTRLRNCVVASFLLVAVSGLLVDRNDGIQSRADQAVLQIERDVLAAKKRKPQPCRDDPFVFDTPPCKTADTSPDYILWGDSHASSVFAALEAAAGSGRNGHTYQATCPPVPDAYLKSKKFSFTCPQFTQETLSRIEALPENIPLVIAFRMAIYTDGYSESPDKPVGLTFIDTKTQDETPATAQSFTSKLGETLCTLADEGRPVYVLQPLPEFPVDISREISRDIMFEGHADDVKLPLTQYMARQNKVLHALATAQEKCGIRILDPTPYLCTGGVCHGSLSGLPLYTDDNHIGIHGAERLIPLFKQVFTTPM